MKIRQIILIGLSLLIIVGCGYWPSREKVRKGFEKEAFKNLHQLVLASPDLHKDAKENCIGVSGTSNPPAPPELEKLMKKVGIRYLCVYPEHERISYVFRSDWENSTGIEFFLNKNKYHEEKKLKKGVLEDWGNGFFYYNDL